MTDLKVRENFYFVLNLLKEKENAVVFLLVKVRKRRCNLIYISDLIVDNMTQFFFNFLYFIYNTHQPNYRVRH